MFTPDQIELLKQPLDPRLIRVKPTAGSPAYIPGWVVIEAANQDRFWSKIDIGDADDCWVWTKAIFRNSGYGQFYARWEGRDHSLSAHRFAYASCYGPVPQGACVLHRCDIKICCNPLHLFAGTIQDNVADMVAKGRQGHGEKPARRGKGMGNRNGARLYPERLRRGENNHATKLTLAQVHWIKEELRKDATCKQLAEECGVDYCTIWLIAKGRSWKWVS